MRYRDLFISFVLLFAPAIFQAQAFKWANTLGSPNNTTTVKTVRPYTGTNVLLTGSFAAPTLALGSQTLNNAGQDDGYVAIADENGQYTWAAKFGGSGRDFAIDAAAAPNGEFVVVGVFNSISINIGGTNLSNSGETDAFVARYNADKTLAWAKKIGSADIDEVSGAVMDTDGNAYLSGQVLDKFTNALKHVFLRKYDTAGNQVWERKGEMTGGYPQTSLAIDGSQNVYLSGSVYGTANFGGTSMTSDTSYGAFIVKYSPSGTFLDHLLDTSLDRFNSIHAAGSNLFACAEKQNGFCIGWGWPLAQTKISVLKFDNNLNTVWHKTAGGESFCQSYDIAKSLSVDEGGNVYVAGYFFSDTLRFAGQSHANPFNLQYYYPQIFVLKYSPNGAELWGKSLGGIHSDEATCIHAVGEDTFYLGGNFESDPAAFGAHNLHNTGTLDSIYVHLRPARYGRKSMGFLALFDKGVSGTNPEPTFENLLLFPNPVTDHLTVRLKAPTTSPITFHLVASDGRLLRKTGYPAQVSEISEDLTGLPPGIYLVLLKTKEGVFSGKLVKL